MSDNPEGRFCRVEAHIIQVKGQININIMKKNPQIIIHKLSVPPVQSV